jgi:hypothetical protein
MLELELLKLMLEPILIMVIILNVNLKDLEQTKKKQSDAKKVARGPKR